MFSHTAAAPAPPYRIEALAPTDDALVDLVAERMRLTLIEVEGEAVGGAMYTLGWLRDRVLFHLDPAQCVGQVWLARSASGEVAGHTIVRVEHDAQGAPFGLFSTTYVDPAHRRHGVAQALLQQGEHWTLAQGLARSATWTSSTNARLIALYARHGYAEDERGAHPDTGTVMVRLARALP